MFFRKRLPAPRRSEAGRRELRGQRGRALCNPPGNHVAHVAPMSSPGFSCSNKLDLFIQLQGTTTAGSKSRVLVTWCRDTETGWQSLTNAYSRGENEGFKGTNSLFIKTTRTAIEGRQGGWGDFLLRSAFQGKEKSQQILRWLCSAPRTLRTRPA